MARVYGQESKPTSNQNWSGLTPREVEDLHKNDDVDTRPEAHHHTIGSGPNQAAPGSLVARVDAIDGQGESPGTGGEINPAGSIVLFAGNTEPSGWGFADGAAISRAANPKLFAAIGTTYGDGNGSTTFNKPNLKGRIPVGRDTTQTEFDTLGETGGAKTHDHPLTGGTAYAELGIGSGTIAAHRVTAPYTSDARKPVSGSLNSGGSETNAVGVTGDTDAASTLQPYIVLNYIIKLG